MGSFRDLIAYKKSFALSMDIFTITKKFLKEETYSLIDQIDARQGLFLHPLLRLIKNGNIQITL
jgi:hypothetical protein